MQDRERHDKHDKHDKINFTKNELIYHAYHAARDLAYPVFQWWKGKEINRSLF